MSADAPLNEDRLAAFDAQQTQEGLLRRYARGRVAYFVKRQFMTLAGVLALALILSPYIGMAALLAALLGEGVDCLVLRYVPHLLDRGVPVRRIWVLTTVTAGLQAVTITICMLLALLTADEDSATFFVFALLAGAAINAGLTMATHRAAALARLAVYSIFSGWMLVNEAIVDAMHLDEHIYFEFVGILIMAYVIGLFVNYVNLASRGHVRKSRALIKREMEIRDAYQKLQTKELETRKLALVAEQAHDSVVISDINGQITWVNQAFTRSTGYSAKEAIGRTPDDLLNGPETDLAASDGIRAAARAGRPHRAEILNYRKNGEKIWVETNLAPVLNASGVPELTVAIERDITETKQHQRELQKARLDAEKSERAKTDFLAAMSHEIRTPMNGIIGMSDLMCEADLPPEPKEYADIIRSSAAALLKIINDILDLSKLGAGKFEVSSEAFSLQDCLSGAVKLLQPQAQEKGITLDLSFDTVLPQTMLGDDGRIRQILLNLIGNAIKFTSTGSVGVVVRHNKGAGDHRIEIDVRDTGIGIAADSLDHIFDQFAQADVSTTRRFGGTGLGLTISQLLARRMGGDITVTSEEGAGSCFTLKLVLRDAMGEIADPAPARAVPDSMSLEGLRVLVAEDNRTNRLIIKKFLGNQPIYLDFAQNGREAVAQALAYPPDLIFMDISMPEMDGLEATGAIRAANMPQPVIVALTANAFESDRKACLKAGMDDFLTKPVRRADLLAKLALVRNTAQHQPVPVAQGP